ncbi:putative FAD-linked oxidoreductase [Pseudocercospora fuligena]|uniref:Putative FAD-linked oxidoreductase n=1 Tax=Pseudocercospora fuligena TaxID=685502 RepID=A0A8H6RGF3_9PEZI|nr:putative FAD-linked oxidoreductase [Pseudocercospora fuligena]
MTFPSILSFSFILGTIVSTAHGAPNADATAACKAIQAQYPKQVAGSAFDLNVTLAFDYTQTRNDYWSLANADVKPACIFFPGAADEIAFAVKTLNKYPTAPWSVKGGGHNPNVGYSSTQDGVLIATKENMAYTKYDPGTQLAHVGPGNRWIDVANVLQPYNRAVVSGRLGVVGAAGLTLGGGLSFLSTEYGMTADNVVAYNVVTAAGEMTTASKTQNSDLFSALKGGGNQFAIVTEYIMQTYPIGQVWGGHKIYTMDKKSALLNATHNLVSNYSDPKAAVIVTFSSTIDTLVDIFVVFYFYNGPTMGSILSEFDKIPALIDATKPNRNYNELLDSNSAFSIDGMRYLIRTGTLPNLPGDQGVDLYNNCFDTWYSLGKKSQLGELDNYVFSLAFQPVPHQLAQASVSNPNSVNLLGLDPKLGDKVFMEYDVSWLLPSTDQKAAAAITAQTQPVQDYRKQKYAGVKPTNYQSGNLEFAASRPLFMNDAMFNQDPLRSYPDDVYAKLKQIQRQRDPNGFFSKRTGGFKFS